ncbi:MAG: glycosyltransferase family 2 protein [Bacteroidales bacterium]|jgi:GT2 family glycosyltransferase|nr:glycosyltransferase family 2 protein [Bacteroidales bacterium]
MKSIAALLTVHNRKEQTLACLKALFLCDLPEDYRLDVFLVDDGCTDGTPEAVKEQFSQVKIIQGDGSLFWNRGMHLAWTTAADHNDYDFFLWLNDDTILFPEAIRELLVCSESESHQSIICGSTCAVNDESEITYGGRIFKDTLVIPGDKKQHCDYFHGNIVLVPRGIFSKLGTNDPFFRHALGDFDYGLRAGKRGISSIVAPHILGTCDEHETFAAWCDPKTPVLKRFKLLYTPLGNHPFEFFKYERRHQGLGMACFHFLTNHLRALMPVLWKDRNK